MYNFAIKDFSNDNTKFLQRQVQEIQDLILRENNFDKNLKVGFNAIFYF